MNELTVEQLLNKAINKEKLTTKQWEKFFKGYIQGNYIYDNFENPYSYCTDTRELVFPYKGVFYMFIYQPALDNYNEDDFSNSKLFKVKRVTEIIESWKVVK